MDGGSGLRINRSFSNLQPHKSLISLPFHSERLGSRKVVRDKVQIIYGTNTFIGVAKSQQEVTTSYTRRKFIEGVEWVVVDWVEVEEVLEGRINYVVI